MVAYSSLKASDSYDTLKSSIVHGRFSALSLQRNTTYTFISTFSPHADLQSPAARLHRNHKMDPEPDTWRLLGSMPAIHQYKIHPQRAIIYEVTGLNEVLVIPKLDSTFLHNRLTDSWPDCWRVLGLTPDTQLYKGSLCGIKTQEIADRCRSCLYRYLRDPRTRWQIPPQPLGWFWIWLQKIVGLDASYAMVWGMSLSHQNSGIRCFLWSVS